MTLRLVFVHGDQEIEMPAGESFVGRGVDCTLRFNDAAISRRHLRVICTREAAYVENLSLTNGTRVNGSRLSETFRLSSGDQVEIGHRILKVSLDQEQRSVDSGPVTVTTPVESDVGILVAQAFDDPGDYLESDQSELTRPGQGPAALLAILGAPEERNCPKCRTRVRSEENDCPKCGYHWSHSGWGSRTQEIKIAELQSRPERRHVRHVVQVPVIYSSEYLTLDAVAADLSTGGMFIASELLDPVGTPCEITALPDGRAAVQLGAEVCHVSTETMGNRPPGFGVRFTKVPRSGEDWLRSICARVD